LSVDPFIQDPGNSQSINSFSYIMNNPLSGTDPTGYSSTGTRIEGAGGASPCTGCVSGLDQALQDSDSLVVFENKDGSQFVVATDNNGNLYKSDTYAAADSGAAGAGTDATGIGAPQQAGGENAATGSGNSPSANSETDDYSSNSKNASQTDEFATRGDDRTWGSYLPGTKAGENAAEYWSNIAVNSDHPLSPLAHVPGVFSVLWTDETAGDTAFTLGSAGVGSALNGLKTAMGPLRQWIRFGPSYSANLGQTISLSLRWGASPAKGGKYVQQIPNPALQRFNQWLRARKFPGESWRTQDPGHLHIKP
jgi:hypothetical protein